MEILADEDVYFRTVRFFRELNYEVETVSNSAVSGKKDEVLVEYAYQGNAILLTRDKDFGRLVFLQLMPTSGVMLLRIQPNNLDSVHHQAQQLFEEIPIQQIQRSFITVKPFEYRIRELPQT